MATIFGFLYIGYTLKNTTEPSMCGGDAAIMSNYFDHLFCLLISVSSYLHKILRMILKENFRKGISHNAVNSCGVEKTKLIMKQSMLVSSSLMTLSFLTTKILLPAALCAAQATGI